MGGDRQPPRAQRERLGVEGERLRAAAAASGTPELSDLDMARVTTHYLDSDGRPQLLTRSTPIKALRKTKAFRVAITDEVEVELPPESVIMDH